MWDWRGAVALVLAAAIGIGWATAVVLAVLDDEPVNTQGATLLWGLGGTLAGGVIGWLGAHGRNNRDDGPGSGDDT